MKFAVAFVCLALLAAAKAQDEGLHICWRDMYNRGLGGLPTFCEGDNEYEAGLCYSKCPEGFSGIGPLCLEKCAADRTDIGLFCVKGFDFDTKSMKTRGMGHMPSCDPMTEDRELALCHKHCKTGYKGVGPVCWQQDSGTTSYPNQCNSFVYGKTAEDCQNFNAVLHEAGIESAECISALGNAVMHQQLAGLGICKDLIKGVMYQFGNSTLCHKATFKRI